MANSTRNDVEWSLVNGQHITWPYGFPWIRWTYLPGAIEVIDRNAPHGTWVEIDPRVGIEGDELPEWIDLPDWVFAGTVIQVSLALKGVLRVRAKPLPDPKADLPLTTHEIAQLSTYNAEKHRGLVHEAAYVKRMKYLQARFHKEVLDGKV